MTERMVTRQAAFSGPDGYTIAWDSENDTDFLDPRTAAVLALGEAALEVNRHHIPMPDGLLTGKDRYTVFFRALKAALAADAEAGR